MNTYNTTGSGSTTNAGNRSSDGDSMNGNAILYDVGKILKVGGAAAYDNGIANSNAFTIDINNGTAVSKMPNIAYARSFISSVVLPNGQVAVFGGQGLSVAFTDSQPVFAAEIWDPATGWFNTYASAKIPRTYHSVALLMQDGRVLVGGGGLCGGCTTNHPNVEIFTPPYLQNADGSAAVRPLINSAPATAGYGTNITVSTNTAISKFALVRQSSVTHTVNNDQRRIPLSFTTTGTNTYSLSIPTRRGVAVPGYYFLFAMNSADVPSVAKIIRIG